MNRKKITEQIGSNIKRLRKEHKKTQEQVSESIGISRTVYTRYENGEIEIPSPMIVGICAALNVTVSDIYEGVVIK